ncbi:hypothetical protein N9D31_01850 [Oligoflexaceae bacterium]|nr:hypothetical protein [Oligoflexaceae bacterium]
MTTKTFHRVALAACISLASMSLSCLSMQEDEKPNIEEALETQKSIIINFLNRGEPSKAFVELRPAMQRFPGNADLLSLMGLTQLALRNPSNAIKYLREANDIESNSTSVLNLSSAYIENSEYARAIKILKKHMKAGKAFKAYTYPERLFHNLGLAYSKLKREKPAIKYFKRALGENSSFYLSLLQLGHSYQRLKKYNQARIQYRKSIKACNQCYEAVNSLARNYVVSGNQTAAVSLLKNYSKNKKIPNEMRVQAKNELAKLAKPNGKRSRTAKNLSNKRK